MAIELEDVERERYEVIRRAKLAKGPPNAPQRSPQGRPRTCVVSPDLWGMETYLSGEAQAFSTIGQLGYRKNKWKSCEC